MRSEKYIWILEDDTGSQFVYEEILGLRYPIKIFSCLTDFKEALKAPQKEHPDFIIADLKLPDGTFLDLIRFEDTRKLIHCPFVVVSSVDDLDILRLCFDYGATDYITKPFGKGEIIVKMERLMTGEGQRTQSGQTDLIVDLEALTVCRGKLRSLPLTQKELQLFNILHNSEGQAAAREEIVQRIWGNTKVGNKTLDVHLLHLRNKLGPLKLEILHIAPESYQLKLALSNKR